MLRLMLNLAWRFFVWWYDSLSLAWSDQRMLLTGQNLHFLLHVCNICTVCMLRWIHVVPQELENVNIKKTCKWSHWRIIRIICQTQMRRNLAQTCKMECDDIKWPCTQLISTRPWTASTHWVDYFHINAILYIHAVDVEYSSCPSSPGL